MQLLLGLILSTTVLSQTLGQDCDVCAAWNNAVSVSETAVIPNVSDLQNALQFRKRRSPRRGGGGGSKGSSGSKGKGTSGSKYSGSSSWKNTAKKYVSASGKLILANKLWKPVNKSRRPKYYQDNEDEYENWEEEAMERGAYIDDSNVCHCSSFVIKVSCLLLDWFQGLAFKSPAFKIPASKNPSLQEA